jgi:hypothetical protein
MNLNATELVDPQFVAADCGCRGGTWQQDASGYGICIPGAPTGKAYSMQARGCVPITGFQAPEVLVPFYKNWKFWLALLAVAGVVYYVQRQESKASNLETLDETL